MPVSLSTGGTSSVSCVANVDDINANAGQCPFVLRHAMLNDLHINLLKCTHRTIPHVTDVEFDVFIQKIAPVHQLVVVAVVSSTSVSQLTTFNAHYNLLHAI